jgi:hypothetical protein
MDRRTDGLIDIQTQTDRQRSDRERGRGRGAVVESVTDNYRTFRSGIERHDVVDEDGGQVEEEKVLDRFVPINLLLQVLPELLNSMLLDFQHLRY